MALVALASTPVAVEVVKAWRDPPPPPPPEMQPVVKQDFDALVIKFDRFAAEQAKFREEWLGRQVRDETRLDDHQRWIDAHTPRNHTRLPNR